jgi:hypothetical protein
VPKQQQKRTVDHVFAFTSEVDLDEQIQAFKRAHADAHEQDLALDSKRALGPGKVRLSFRVVERRRK